MTKAQMKVAHELAQRIAAKTDEDTFAQGIIDGGTTLAGHRAVKFTSLMSPWQMGDSVLLLSGPRCALSDLMASGMPANVRLHILAE